VPVFVYVFWLTIVVDVPNGDNYSDPLTILVYDSVCYECNATSMTCVEQVSVTLLHIYRHKINHVDDHVFSI
jgi:hypothetical protein